MSVYVRQVLQPGYREARGEWWLDSKVGVTREIVAGRVFSPAAVRVAHARYSRNLILSPSLLSAKGNVIYMKRALEERGPGGGPAYEVVALPHVSLWRGHFMFVGGKETPAEDRKIDEAFLLVLTPQAPSAGDAPAAAPAAPGTPVADSPPRPTFKIRPPGSDLAKEFDGQFDPLAPPGSAANPTDRIRVEGAGENEFGKFTLIGALRTTDMAMLCEKAYTGDPGSAPGPLLGQPGLSPEDHAAAEQAQAGQGPLQALAPAETAAAAAGPTRPASIQTQIDELADAQLTTVGDTLRQPGAMADPAAVPPVRGAPPELVGEESKAADGFRVVVGAQADVAAGSGAAAGSGELDGSARIATASFEQARAGGGCLVVDASVAAPAGSKRRAPPAHDEEDEEEAEAAAIAAGRGGDASVWHAESQPDDTRARPAFVSSVPLPSLPIDAIAAAAAVSAAGGGLEGVLVPAPAAAPELAPAAGGRKRSRKGAKDKKADAQKAMREVVGVSFRGRPVGSSGGEWLGPLRLGAEAGVLCGDLYEGEIVDGVPHGFGTAVYRSGFMYEGSFQRGRETGWGVVSDQADNTVYEGELLGGHPSGSGTLYFANGDVYAGHWRDGLFDGWGSYTVARGVGSYEGDWNRGLMHGKGKLTYGDGSTYDGEWKDARRDGRGELATKAGLEYKGEWADDMPHGRGECTYADGSKYDGTFKAGQRDGRGAYRFASGANYHGRWHEDKMAGTGGVSMEQPVVQDGEWMLPLRLRGDVRRIHLHAGFTKLGE